MNLDDLTSVLHDRADDLPALPHSPRMTGIQSQVRATRRRRALTGAVCLLLVVVGTVYATITPTTQESQPATTTVQNFPDYLDGTRIVAKNSAKTPTRTMTVRFVPQSLDLTMFTRCDKPLSITSVLNGHNWGSGTCAAGSVKASDWAKYDVVVGRPSVLTVTVDGLQVTDPSAEQGIRIDPAPDGETFAAAVGEAVPLTSYPFPPRPAELETLPATQLDEISVVRPDPADPNRQRQVTAKWAGRGQLVAHSNTPGRLRVLVNDVEVFDTFYWEYKASGVYGYPLDDWERQFGLRLEVGQQVTVTVIPERTSGDWMVELPVR